MNLITYRFKFLFQIYVIYISAQFETRHM